MKNAQRHKKKRTSYKINEVRSAIREGIETGAVKMNAIEPPKVNVKKEASDDELDLVNEVWLQNSEHSAEYQGESDNTNSSDDAPLRSSRPSTSKKGTSSRKNGNLDLELTSMLMSCSIPFEVIDHPNFKKFVKKLQMTPSYQLPRSRDLQQKIITMMANSDNNYY